MILSQFPGAERVEIKLPTKLAACNPSIAWDGDKIRAVVRTLNYRLLPSGSIWIKGSAPDTVNWLVEMDSASLAQLNSVQIDDTEIRQSPICRDGLEDMRLFAWKGAWWGLASAHSSRNDVNTMVLAPVSPVMTEKQVLLSPNGEKKEKNWGIYVDGQDLKLVHWFCPVSVYKFGGSQMLEPVFYGDGRADLVGWSGSSQIVPYKGRLVTCLHRRMGEKNGKKPIYYAHRLVEYDADTWDVTRVSPIFLFEAEQIEFNSGLVITPENVLFSYGVMDAAAVVLRLPIGALDMIFEGRIE